MGRGPGVPMGRGVGAQMGVAVPWPAAGTPPGVAYHAPNTDRGVLMGRGPGALMTGAHPGGMMGGVPGVLMTGASGYYGQNHLPQLQNARPPRATTRGVKRPAPSSSSPPSCSSPPHKKKFREDTGQPPH